jgi:hypothetical protein
VIAVEEHFADAVGRAGVLRRHRWIVSCSRARLQLAAILHTANHLFDTPLVEADYEILTSNK